MPPPLFSGAAVPGEVGQEVLVDDHVVRFRQGGQHPCGLSGIPPLSLAGFELRAAEHFFYLIWVCVAAAALAVVRLLDSRPGRAIRALDGNAVVAEAFGVWQEKKMYGKVSMGIVRSAFLVGPDGRLEQVWYKISPKDTPTNLLDALASR